MTESNNAGRNQGEKETTMTIDIDLDRLDEVRREGLGDAAAAEWRQLCVMEAVDYVTWSGSRWFLTDHPPCACPAVTRLAIELNDTATEEQRQRLVGYIPRIAGSRGTFDDTGRRYRLRYEWHAARAHRNVTWEDRLGLLDELLAAGPQGEAVPLPENVTVVVERAVARVPVGAA